MGCACGKNKASASTQLSDVWKSRVPAPVQLLPAVFASGNVRNFIELLNVANDASLFAPSETVKWTRFDPEVIPSSREADIDQLVQKHFEPMYRMVVFCRFVPKDSTDADYIDKILDTIRRFTVLRYGDYRDVVFISECGLERHAGMASAAARSATDNVLAHNVVRTARMEFSIPRNDHLLLNLSRAIYNVHPWDEVVMQVYEERDHRRYGIHNENQLMIKEVYRVDDTNATKKADALEKEAIEKTGQKPDDPMTWIDPLGELESKAPQLREKDWRVADCGTVVNLVPSTYPEDIKKTALLPEIIKKPEEVAELISQHWELSYRIVVFVRLLPRDSANADYVDRILDTIRRFTTLRYGDYRDVAFISAAGLERHAGMATTAARSATDNILEHNIVRTARMEFSIPRDDHLLVNLTRAIYNAHPWDEVVLQVYEDRDHRRYGRHDLNPMKIRDVYRVDKSNGTGKVNKLEKDAIIKTEQKPTDFAIFTDPLGNLESKAPQVREGDWHKVNFGVEEPGPAPQLGSVEQAAAKVRNLMSLLDFVTDPKMSAKEEEVKWTRLEPEVVADKAEAASWKQDHFEPMYRITMYVKLVRPDSKEADYVDKILDTIRRFTALRYGDYRDVIFLSAGGLERHAGMATAAARSATENVLMHNVVRTSRLEFSIPRNDHLLLNLTRAIYNVHPWDEVVYNVYEVLDMRRYGLHTLKPLKIKEVYRVDTSNASGKVNAMEKAAIERTGLDPNDDATFVDPLGNLEAKAPQIREKDWYQATFP